MTSTRDAVIELTAQKMHEVWQSMMSTGEFQTWWDLSRGMRGSWCEIAKIAYDQGVTDASRSADIPVIPDADVLLALAVRFGESRDTRVKPLRSAIDVIRALMAWNVTSSMSRDQLLTAITTIKGSPS